jgi:gluconate 5-dehydrogenase
VDSPPTGAALFDLRGQVALVTGGSRGLGLAMAEALGTAGARLAISARKQEELDAARAALEGRGLATIALRSDLAEPSAASSLADAVLEAYGQVDVLVNNAGAAWGAPAESHPREAWQKVFDVNVHGAFALTQAIAARSMIPRKRGSIVMVASINGLGGNAPGGTPTAAYNTSKAALINLARCLAAEWGRHGIRVNALLPGLFPTKMSSVMIEKHGGGYLKRTPLGRFGDVERDLAGPIVFLASDASRYVTGACLTVDGGFTALV